MAMKDDYTPAAPSASATLSGSVLDSFDDGDCVCLLLKDGTRVLAPYCELHGKLTDGKHGELYDLRQVVPQEAMSGTAVGWACVHEPILLGKTLGPLSVGVNAPLGTGLNFLIVQALGTSVAVCRKCRCLYVQET